MWWFQPSWKILIKCVKIKHIWDHHLVRDFWVSYMFIEQNNSRFFGIHLKFDANRKNEPKDILSNCGLASWWWIPWDGIRKKWPKKTIQGYLKPTGKLTAISRRQKWWELGKQLAFPFKTWSFLRGCIINIYIYILDTQHTHIQKDDTFINNQNPWIFGYPFLRGFRGRIWSRSPSFPINRSKKPWANDLQLGHPAKPCEAPKGLQELVGAR